MDMDYDWVRMELEENNARIAELEGSIRALQQKHNKLQLAVSNAEIVCDAGERVVHDIWAAFNKDDDQ